MRVLIMGAADGVPLADELTASGVAVEGRADGSSPGDGQEEIAQIARDLREFEALLGDRGPDAVLVASDSPAALAAVLVATKAGVPAGWLEIPELTADQRANARVIRQIADTALAPEAAAVVEWARDGYPARA